MKRIMLSAAIIAATMLSACVSVQDSDTIVEVAPNGDFALMPAGPSRDQIAAIAGAATYDERATRALIDQTTVWKSTRLGEDYLVHVVRSGSEEAADEFVVVVSRDAAGNLVTQGVIAF